MHKIFSSFIFLCFITIQLLLVNADAKEDETMQIVGEKIEQNGNIITATGNIIIFSPNYFVKADKAIYDRNTTIMQLFGNVNMSKNKETISITNYAFIDMKNEINNATPILLIDKKTNVWINAKTIDKKSDLNIIKDATLSSCDCSDPTWSIGFSSGDYNTTDQWINTYNNTLYIHDIPAWYFLIPAIPYATVPTVVTAYIALKMPYMGFSTNRERRSGLLKPQFGYGQTDGFFYAQPIYYAPEPDVDFEYIPQIRTDRGNGHEAVFRYADSAYSNLEISAGIFSEKDSYYRENNLKNQNHFGGILKYDRTKLFSEGDATDGFYAFLETMNDIEYSNTQYKHDNSVVNANKILESKVKYFYNTPSFNTSIEAINYNDISKDNNDDTMQIMPSITAHKYSDSLFFNKFRNSIDFKYKRQDRVTGLGADTYDLSVPFSYSKTFFDDYLLFTYGKILNLHAIDYTNDLSEPKKDGTLITGKDIVSFETDLLKPYETKLHAVKFLVTYEKPNQIKANGDLYGINSVEVDSTLSIFPFTKDTENITLSFNQSLFNKNNLSPIFNHKINQKILMIDGSSKLENLENELMFYLPYTSLSNRLLFNHDEQLIVNSTSSVKFKKDDFFTDLDYSFAKDTTGALDGFKYKDLPTSESITAQIGTKVNKYYTLSYREQYDLAQHTSKLKEYKMTIDKRCWSLDLMLRNSLVATATNSTSTAKRQDIVYATITLKPIFSFKQNFIIDEKVE